MSKKVLLLAVCALATSPSPLSFAQDATPPFIKKTGDVTLTIGAAGITKDKLDPNHEYFIQATLATTPNLFALGVHRNAIVADLEKRENLHAYIITYEVDFTGKLPTTLYSITVWKTRADRDAFFRGAAHMAAFKANADGKLLTGLSAPTWTARPADFPKKWEEVVARFKFAPPPQPEKEETQPEFDFDEDGGVEAADRDVEVADRDEDPCPDLDSIPWELAAEYSGCVETQYQSPAAYPCADGSCWWAGDADLDGILDPGDLCPYDPWRSSPHACGGCTPPDYDGDGTPDCQDICPDDPGNDSNGDGLCDNTSQAALCGASSTSGTRASTSTY